MQQVFTLTQEQQHHFDIIVENKRNTVNNSEGGTGKSVLIHKLKRELGHETLFLSTTGISALAIGGSTVHRGLSIPIGHPTKETLKKISSQVSKLFAKGTVKRIVCDEFSMITPSTWFGFCERIKRFNKATRNRKAGEIKVHFLGDLLQIPSVMLPRDIAMAREAFGTSKFYKMQQFKDMDFKLVEFTKVLRQDNVEMKGHLSAIRTAVPIRFDGRKPVYNESVMAALAYFNKRVTTNLPKGITVIATTNKSVAQYNQIAFNNNTNVCGVYTSEFTGDFKASDLACGTEVQLKVGLGVMILKNSSHESEVEYSNGDVGTVLNMTAEGASIRLARTGEEVLIEPTRWEKHGYETRTNEEGEEELCQYVSGSATGIALKQNAAISAHRSQGATLDKAIIDLGWSCTFATGIVYVMLSRLRSIEGLYLKRAIRPEDISVDIEAIKWLEELRKGS